MALRVVQVFLGFSEKSHDDAGDVDGSMVRLTYVAAWVSTAG